MAKTQWTSLAQAVAYINACNRNKTKGLKYCSAVDFVKHHGKVKCSRCGTYKEPDEIVTKDADGNEISICKKCYERALAERNKDVNQE